MVQIKASTISGTLGIFSLLVTIFLVSDAAAQDQYCECNDAVNTVTVRRAPVRRVARRSRVRRSYRTARVTRVRPVYRTVYVPETRAASYVAYADRDDCNCDFTPTTARVVVTEPVYTNYDRVYTGGSYYDTERIARGWGHRDGFKDGYKAALKYREYDPENNGDFRDANNGYKRRFGSKYLYKDAYREGYVRGYESGFRSTARGETYGSVRY